MNAYFNIGSGIIQGRYLPKSPSIQELFQEISGMLILHSDVWEFPRPYPRTFINILGLNIKQDPGPIPKVLICHKMTYQTGCYLEFCRTYSTL